MKKFLPVFSYLFHPLLVPVFATVLFFTVTNAYFQNDQMFLVLIQVLILTMLLPISVYYFLKSLGLLHSAMVMDKKERKLPLAIYAFLLLVLIKHSLPESIVPELFYYFFGSLISTIIALSLVLFNHKASLHVMGVTSFTVFAMSLSAYYHLNILPFAACLVVCCGCVASARLQAKAHTMDEVILGALIGILPQVGLWYFWLFR